MKFEFNDQFVNIILQTLVKQPFEVVAPIITDIHRQIMEQQQQQNIEQPEQKKDKK